jgi:gliding motility-associated lipoprotein GldH
MPRNSTLFLLCLCLGLASCDPNQVYEKNLKIEESNWDRNQQAHFNFEISDTVSAYNFYLNFRHAGDYPYKNLYLFTRLKGPSNKTARDTAQMLLADSKGRWMGKGIGDIYDYQFKFKEMFKFPNKGEYSVDIEQAMRDQILPNVTDIGIRIEKVNQ